MREHGSDALRKWQTKLRKWCKLGKKRRKERGNEQKRGKKEEEEGKKREGKRRRGKKDRRQRKICVRIIEYSLRYGIFKKPCEENVIC